LISIPQSGKTFKPTLAICPEIEAGDVISTPEFKETSEPSSATITSIVPQFAPVGTVIS